MKSTALGAIFLATLVAIPAAAQPGGGKPATTPPATAPPATTPPPKDDGTTTPPPKDDGTTTPPDTTDGTADQEGDDVDSLRQEYLHLRDELYKSRARAAAVSSALYSTKISIKLSYQSGRYYTVDRAVVRVDRGSVYDDTTGAIANDDAVRFEGYIAPGRHLVSIRVEATGKDDDRFTSATETSFVVEAVSGKDLTIVARAKDGGDIPYQWKKGEHGSYKLSIEADVKTVASAGGEAKPAKPAKPEKKTAARTRHPKKERRRAASR